MTRPTLTVVGDALLDRDVAGRVERICPDAPVPVVDATRDVVRPGGAALAAAVARRWGIDVRFVTAVGEDAAGRELCDLLAAAGVDVVDLGMAGATPEKIRVRADDQSLVRIDRGGDDGAPRTFPAVAREAVISTGAVLVSDYGRGLTASRPVRAVLEEVAARTPVVWDPHPRGSWPTAATRLVTPNQREAATFAARTGARPAPRTDQPDDRLRWPRVSAHARSLVEQWRCAGVCVTLGDAGALLSTGDDAPYVVPARPAPTGDPCGAGDAFAAAAAVSLAAGALLTEAVGEAVDRAREFVCAGGASSITEPSLVGASRPVERQARSAPRGGPDAGSDGRGVLVAAGGCFDVLHAGHVALLQAARQLGDSLVVCLNSDASVRRLKGPGRPVVPQDDRAALLRALGCVDRVEIFEEDTPAEVLRRLRPAVFVKGGDYSAAEMPEARIVGEWDGQAVVVPYLAGRSSTSLIDRVARRA